MNSIVPLLFDPSLLTFLGVASIPVLLFWRRDRLAGIDRGFVLIVVGTTMISLATFLNYNIEIVLKFNIQPIISNSLWEFRQSFLAFFLYFPGAITVGLGLSSWLPALQRQSREVEIRRVEQKHQEEMRHSRERFRDFADAASDWFWEMDENLNFTFGSDRFFEITGLKTADIYNRKRGIYIDPLLEDKNSNKWQQHLRDLDAHKSFRNFEYQIHGREGRVIQVSVSGKPVFSDEGKFLGYRGTGSDVSDRKLAEASIRKLSQAMEQSPASVIIADRSGIIEYVNPRFEQVTGYKAEEVIGRKSDVRRTGKLSTEEHDDLFSKLMTGKVWRGEFHNKRKDGSLFWEAVSISPIRDEEGIITNFLAVREDITDQKIIQQELASSVQKMQIAFDASPTIASITTVADGCYLDVNQTFLNALGYSRSEIIGKTVHDINVWADREDRTKVVEAIKRRGFLRNFETLICKSDGTTSPMIYNGVTININGEECILSNTIDISDRKRLEEQFRRSQKMEAVGQLTSGIAHDFNNILAIIQGNLEFLEGMVPDDDQALEHVNRAQKGASRGADLTRKLLGFSRKDTADVDVTAVNLFIVNLENLIAKSLTASINVETRLDENLWNVAIDPGDFEDAILNLSLNARDAMPDGGCLTITTENKVFDEEYVRQHQDGQVGEFVRISVSDTGIGMNEEIMDKVLEPFFSTKEHGRGTGLGLSMVYGFAQRSNGHLTLHSEVGKGTTVCLYLPRAKNQDSKLETLLDETLDLPTGSGTILVVDDEEDLRDLTTSRLQNLGYKTLTAENGCKALEILEQIEDIDLLFSDVVMPGEMDGFQLALAAHESNEDLKILLTSGFTLKSARQQIPEDDFLISLKEKLLTKPYNMTELAFALRSTLVEDWR